MMSDNSDDSELEHDSLVLQRKSTPVKSAVVEPSVIQLDKDTSKTKVATWSVEARVKSVSCLVSLV